MAVEIRTILTQGTFDFGGARKLRESEHFEAFETALATVVSLLCAWFGVSRAVWEPVESADADWVFSKFLKGTMCLDDAVEVEPQSVRRIAHDIYYNTDVYDFRIVLCSDEIAVAVEGCSDPIVLSFTARSL